MMDEAQVRSQLADFQRQQDWLNGAIQALRAVLGDTVPPAKTAEEPAQ